MTLYSNLLPKTEFSCLSPVQREFDPGREDLFENCSAEDKEDSESDSPFLPSSRFPFLPIWRPGQERKNCFIYKFFDVHVL